METKAETRRRSTGGTMNLGSKLNLGKVLSKNRRLNIGRCNSDASQVQYQQLAKAAAATSKYLNDTGHLFSSSWSLKRNS